MSNSQDPLFKAMARRTARQYINTSLTAMREGETISVLFGGLLIDSMSRAAEDFDEWDPLVEPEVECDEEALVKAAQDFVTSLNSDDSMEGVERRAAFDAAVNQHIKSMVSKLRDFAWDL